MPRNLRINIDVKVDVARILYAIVALIYALS
jgi:hypothetical protein